MFLGQLVEMHASGSKWGKLCRFAAPLLFVFKIFARLIRWSVSVGGYLHTIGIILKFSRWSSSMAVSVQILSPHLNAIFISVCLWWNELKRRYCYVSGELWCVSSNFILDFLMIKISRKLNIRVHTIQCIFKIRVMSYISFQMVKQSSRHLRRFSPIYWWSRGP